MQIRDRIIAIVVTVGCVVPTYAERPDALDEALALVDLTRADLGWQPEGWWSRFPADIPYKLRSFDSLFARPFDTIAFARALADDAKKHLDPTTMNEDPQRGVGHLFHAVHSLGTNLRFGGLRGYTANLTAEPTPLVDAILRLHEAAGRPTRFVTFDAESPYPLLREDLNKRAEPIPEPVRLVLGQLVVNVTEASRWADLSFRNVDAEDRIAVARRRNLGEEEVDALDYCPQIDDVARGWDEASLWYAGEKCVQALDTARLALREIENIPAFTFDWETPWGWIRIRGSGADAVDGHDALLIVDLGGDDTYTGPVAASTSIRRLGLLLDCAGNDHYKSGSRPAQGAGITGIGVLLDATGNDVYEAERYAQGVGQFGLGLCADLGGTDRYFTKYSGQGCGYFGIGLLFDSSGNDEYVLYADGQGLGGVSGVGVLADRLGDDTYTAVRDALITKRPSYHSPAENVTVSNAQGCAMGRRGDGADGHSWAGGLGALLDSEGNDRYSSGNWSMGTGYWFGTGILHDGAGNDEYRGVVWTQATGAHFAIGTLIDESGDDRHIGEATANMNIAWGHDFTIALLVNIGGNDVYDVKGDGIAGSINRSIAALIDIGGDDVYRGKAGSRPGNSRYDERFTEKDGRSTYWTDSTSLALFLDVGGTDTYATHPPSDDKSKDDADEPDAPAAPFGGKNNSTWLDEPGSLNPKVRNFSVGIDREDGEIGFSPIPMRPVRRKPEHVKP